MCLVIIVYFVGVKHVLFLPLSLHCSFYITKQITVMSKPGTGFLKENPYFGGFVFEID